MDGRDECPLAARVSCRKEPPTRLVAGNAEVAWRGRCACVRQRSCATQWGERERKKNVENAEKEREGGESIFRGVEFQIRTPSINQEHSVSPEGLRQVCPVAPTQISSIMRANTPEAVVIPSSLPALPSYIFAHKIRFREIHERPMIGGCNDRYGECWWADIAILTNDSWKRSLRCSFRCGSDA